MDEPIGGMMASAIQKASKNMQLIEFDVPE
jgi:hypothetical protein